ncbi:dUTP diphosphatase [Candidatus Accumulibacter sp. ACC012]|jgi:dUTP pyrophosphatase|uniref:dUTP diphosphatase n=1 Tax=Candidatus Accumulibacter sp. ACC012 TaxID=2823332 RepID=UPI0025C5184D|nr:dUTP diphosphatase [Candidatus Accumulibacter sp. ACC012]
MILKIKRLSPAATLPEYSFPGDAGLDISSADTVEIAPSEVRLVPTGIAIELPVGTEAQIRPRSGLALKHGITVLNTPGTIDQGYRGELGVILINHGKLPYQVEVGMRIAQLVIKPVLTVEVEEVEDLSDSERGAGGFGSTGTKHHE